MSGVEGRLNGEAGSSYPLSRGNHTWLPLHWLDYKLTWTPWYPIVASAPGLTHLQHVLSQAG